MMISVSRSNGSDGAVSVMYETQDNTATDNQDYYYTSGTLSWANGDVSNKTFEVYIINDSIPGEGTESVNLSLLANSVTGGVSLGSQNNILLFITDDDVISQVGSSLNFVIDTTNQEDYAQQVDLPTGFGNGDFTLQLWVKPDNSYSIGPTAVDPYQYWSDLDNTPGGTGWWYEGNFLLDGHNNVSEVGTFSLQVFGSGRIRWLFHDGGSTFIAVQPDSSIAEAYILDGNWHQITLVRRCSGNSAVLEQWIDGVLVATNTSPRCTNMRNYWNTWSEFGNDQRGWFWGGEKFSVLSNSKWEDYKGLLDEIYFWSRALPNNEISSNYNQDVTGNETGLVGLYRINESSGASTCNELSATQCIQLYNGLSSQWDTENAPVQ